MKILYFIIVLIGLASVIAFSIPPAKQEVKGIQTKAVVQQEAQKEVAEKPDIPVSMSIPVLQVTAAVESVALDKDGNMDVPKNADNTAWYNLGSKPGERGNAVIAGHFDKANGDPAVFYQISKLTLGDKIITKDAQGKEFTYAVVKIDTYPYDNFPLQEVFGQTQDSMLNLITCEGKWDKATENYSNRTVVFARLIE